MSSASVSSVFGWEQFSAEKGYEGSRTYVYVTAASSQPKKPHDLFFFSLFFGTDSLLFTDYQQQWKQQSFFIHLFSHPPFSLSFTMIMTLQQSNRACLAWRATCQPWWDLLSPDVPWGLPYIRESFSNWERAILFAAGAQTRQGITTLPLASVPASVPQSWTCNCWQPASHRVENHGLVQS